MRQIVQRKLKCNIKYGSVIFLRCHGWKVKQNVQPRMCITLSLEELNV